MPGRNYEATTGSATPYRYGFNGQEKSDEIFEGSTTALFWEYDSRTGRRWNIDPVEKEWKSPYLCLAASPLGVSDVDGDDNFYTYSGGNPNNKGPQYIRVKTNENGDKHYNFKGFINVGAKEIDYKNLTPENIVRDGTYAMLQGHKGYDYDTKLDKFVKSDKVFTLVTLKGNSSITATGDKVEGSPAQSDLNANTEKPQAGPIPKATQKAFDYAGAISTMVQGVSSGFLRGARLATISSDVSRPVVFGIPSSLSGKSLNVRPLGHVKGSTALAVAKAGRIIENASKITTTLAGVVNIVKDGKLSVGDIAVAANTYLKIANPAYGLVTGVYNLIALSFDLPSSDDLVHDAIDYLAPSNFSWNFWGSSKRK